MKRGAKREASKGSWSLGGYGLITKGKRDSQQLERETEREEQRVSERETERKKEREREGKGESESEGERARG